MPNLAEHLEQVERNESLYRDLCRLYTTVPQYSEWEVVALFYAALHYVDAWLASNGHTHPRNHAQRTAIVMNDSALIPISEQYGKLYRLSVLARYEMERPPLQEVRNLENNEYAAIKRHVRSLLEM